MKISTLKFRVVILLIFATIAGSVQSYAGWTKKKDFPIFTQGRWGIQMFEVNGKIYAGGGYEGKDFVANDWAEYDPAADNWSFKNNMPGSSTNRAGGVTFTINGKAYLGLGVEHFNSFAMPTWNFLTDLWEYDDAADTWTKKADFPGTGTGFCGVFVVDNKAYVVGGMTGKLTADGTSEVHEYDPATDKWTKKASYPEGFIKNQPFAFSLNGKGYIVGGQIPGAFTDKTYEYDPAADTWTEKAAYPGGAVSGGVSFVTNGVAYCGLGGKGSSDYPTEFYFYKSDVDEWSYGNGFEFADNGRSFSKAAVISNKVYMLAGYRFDGSVSNQTWFRGLYEVTPSAAASVHNVAKPDDIILYPNPANDILTIKSDKAYDAYTITNLLGQTIKTDKLDNTQTINTSTLPTGQYLLQLSTDTENRISRFSIQ